jgi:3'-phosphoadenosine 5'-phosphosulfate sulfotransferase (PAPS reductase)/FAD synthetase
MLETLITEMTEAVRQRTASMLPAISVREPLRRTGRVIARFSCGAASAVATKLAIEKYGEAVEIYYNDTGSEHPDNERFLAACEKWFGIKIHVLKSEVFKDTWAVWEKRRYLVNHYGAPCTSELKRKPGEAVWNVGDTEVFGYTYGEEKRVAKFQRTNNERIIECPLIEGEITKDDCFRIVQEAGIELPTMYKLGFRNNNCIGCVKARDSVNYWKRVRKYFPDHFDRMARLERELGFQINRVSVKGKRTPIYLDEIPAGDPKGKDEVKISCGMFCETTKVD